MRMHCGEVQSSTDISTYYFGTGHAVNYGQAFISEASIAGVFEEAHTEAWRDVHTSAHLHEALTQWHTCRLPAACFYQKMRGMALHHLLTCTDKGTGECTVACQCYGILSPKRAVSPPIFLLNVSQMQLSNHTICCYHTPSAVCRFCASAQQGEAQTTKISLTVIECSCAILRERRKTAAILAQ